MPKPITPFVGCDVFLVDKAGVLSPESIILHYILDLLFVYAP